MDPASFVPFAQMVGSIGFPVVACWWLLSKALPSMQVRFSADLKAQREDAYAVLEQERLANERERQFAVASMERLLNLSNRDQIDLLKRTAEDVRAMYTLMQDFVRANRGEKLS